MRSSEEYLPSSSDDARAALRIGGAADAQTLRAGDIATVLFPLVTFGIGYAKNDIDGERQSLRDLGVNEVLNTGLRVAFNGTSWGKRPDGSCYGFPSGHAGFVFRRRDSCRSATDGNTALRPETRRVVAVLGLAVIASGCMPHHSELRPPYLVGGVQYTELNLQELAADRCRESSVAFASLPPYPFTTDGCSFVPNGPMTECCIEHDMAYWCGGPSVLRRTADETLRSCIVLHGGKVKSTFMYAGVRLGGARWLPFPWRWGYGYAWPRGGATSSAPRN